MKEDIIEGYNNMLFKRIMMILMMFMCLLYHSSYSFNIKIHNKELLIERREGGLLLHFDFAGHPLIRTSDNVSLMTSFGFAVNGNICELIDGGIGDIEIVTKKSCLPDDAFWFSVMIYTIDNSVLSSNGVYIPAATMGADLKSDHDDERITLVLPLTINDITRGFVLLESLSHLDNTVVKEFLIFVPPLHLDFVQKLLGESVRSLSFPVVIASERVLLDSLSIDTTGVYPYAIQMALKLLSSLVISTDFYMTLDADVISLRPFVYKNIIDSQRRAIYDHEARFGVHPLWWEGSESYLNIHPKEGYDVSSQGFGVTPALLSTYGAQLTINKIVQDSLSSSNENPLEQWLRDFGQSGVIWSEYTLYALTLHHYQVSRNMSTFHFFSLC